MVWLADNPPQWAKGLTPEGKAVVLAVAVAEIKWWAGLFTEDQALAFILGAVDRVFNGLSAGDIFFLSTYGIPLEWMEIPF